MTGTGDRGHGELQILIRISTVVNELEYCILLYVCGIITRFSVALYTLAFVCVFTSSLPSTLTALLLWARRHLVHAEQAHKGARFVDGPIRPNSRHLAGDSWSRTMANWARRSKARSCYLFFFMLILVPLLRPRLVRVGWFGWQFAPSWVRALGI